MSGPTRSITGLAAGAVVGALVMGMVLWRLSGGKPAPTAVDVPAPPMQPAAPRAAAPVAARPATPSVADQPGRSETEVDEMAARSWRQMDNCYRLALARRPDLAGTLAVQLTIAAGGWVTDARATTNTLHDPEMVECALGQIRLWRFPPASADYTGAHTFTFSQ